ncbi:MAG: hypothetical protein HQL23_09530, partial [Candidatus Omnitrophica bacterium]|nr:hypothetical protein [Candidatus Omnitrophota bacterium]
MTLFKGRWAHFVLLVLTVCCVYGPNVFPTFTGDDVFLFRANDFYRYPQNIVKIFSPAYIASDPMANAALGPGKTSHTGCVAFRPVTSASFFLTYFWWQGNPLGLHAENVIWHILVVWLVYLLIRRLTARPGLSLCTAWIFAVHPVQVEVVQTIGYRSDLLASGLVLAAFLMFFRAETASFARRDQAVSLLLFFLALYAKETALVFPLMLIAYGWIMHIGENRRRWFAEQNFFLLAVGIITLIYLAIYFFVYPNAAAKLGFDLNFIDRVKLIVTTGFLHLRGFVFPGTLSLWPAFYMPRLPGNAAEVGVFFLLCAILGMWIWKKTKPEAVFAFFFLWAGIAYLPVANFFSLPTPIADRYLYLPAVGATFCAAYVLECLFDKQSITRLLSWALRVVIIFYLSVSAWHLGANYRNDEQVARKMITDHPDCSQPYLVLGSIWRSRGQYAAAVQCFQRYLINTVGPIKSPAWRPDYEIHTQIGTSCVDPSQAVAAFNRAIALNPGYADAYANRAKAY